jgi:hypothetical protein
MKSFKMKSLAVAVLGLAGFAGSAMAVCPAGASIANGGAWTSSAITQGVQAIVAGGLGVPVTACKLQVALNQSSAVFAKSIVTDTSPVDEPRYRARFYIDLSEITGLTSVLRSTKIFNASSTTSPAGASGEEVAVQLSGTLGAPTAVFTIADSTQPSGFNQFTVALPNPSGSNRIEFDLVQGASATFRYWVTADTTVTTEGSPTGTITNVNNSGWSGVTQAQLGEFAANTNWRNNYTATTHLNFDEFDSRRQTFIGQ